ncbi:MAG: hypothetical protein OEV59_07460 [Deltaproteobacteria bacterium]|nr:hypothetical protein [Deltaproteobacteria bacterium]
MILRAMSVVAVRLFPVILFAVVLGASSVALAVECNVSTFAGNGVTAYSGDGGSSASAQIANPEGLAVDSSGNVFIADTANNRVRKVDAVTGVISTVAGNGTSGYSGDGGQAVNAQIFYPYDVVVDISGNLYIADYGNKKVRKVDTSGAISTLNSGTFNGFDLALDASKDIYMTRDYNIYKLTVATNALTNFAGNGTWGYSGDAGAAVSAQLFYPDGLVFDKSGNMIFADKVNNVVRRIDGASGVITTIAGTGAQGFSGDGGAAAAATLNWPSGVAVDGQGHLYIADTVNNRIRLVNAFTGVISTIAGTGTFGNNGSSGPGSTFQIAYPKDVVLDGAGNIYIADFSNSRILKAVCVDTVPPSTIASHSSGGYSAAFDLEFSCSDDFSGCDSVLYCMGMGCSPSMIYSGPVAINSSTDVSFKSVDNQGNAEQTQTVTYVVSIAAEPPGTPPPSDPPPAPSGLACSADFLPNRLFSSYAGGYTGEGVLATDALIHGDGITMDSAGNIYFVEGDRIRKINAATNTVSTVVGSGLYWGNYDNQLAASVLLRADSVLYMDSSDNLYFKSAYKVYKVNKATGIISLVFDHGVLSYGYDGVVVDASGNLYVAEGGYHRVRRVDGATGAVTLFAGTGVGGYSGDNGPAASAQLNNPAGLAVDSLGNVYIADRWNNRVRKVDVGTGNISTVAGTGANGYSGDGGLAVNAKISGIVYVTVDKGDNLYISDMHNSVVRKVSASTKVITTVWNSPFAVSTQEKPYGVVTDPSGNLYVATVSLLEAKGMSHIYKVDVASGSVSVLAGAIGMGDGGPAKEAVLMHPAGMGTDVAGSLYISETFGNRVRKVDGVTKTISTVASVVAPGDLAVDSLSGDVYVISQGTVKKVSAADASVSTVAGTGVNGYSGDGNSAVLAQLYAPQGIGMDSSGNMYIADTYNKRVRRVNATTGVITTIAGTGAAAATGDGGLAVDAGLLSPMDVAVDVAGNVYIVDGNSLRRIDAVTGVITTAATPLSTVSTSPRSLTLDLKGNAYISYLYGFKSYVAMLPAGTSVLTPLAGVDAGGVDNLLPLFLPIGVTVDRAGNVYAADIYSYEVYKFSCTDVTAPVSYASIAGGAYSAAQEVSLFCQDDYSLCSIAYCTGENCEPTTPYDGAALQIAVDTVLRFSSVDSAGNTEAALTERYSIVINNPTPPADNPPPPADTTAPDTSLALVNASASLQCSDTGSGCAATYYCVGPESCTPELVYTGVPISVTQGMKVRIYSIDNAGNVEAVKSFLVKRGPKRSGLELKARRVR